MKIIYGITASLLSSLAGCVDPNCGLEEYTPSTALVQQVDHGFSTIGIDPVTGGFEEISETIHQYANDQLALLYITERASQELNPSTQERIIARTRYLASDPCVVEAICDKLPDNTYKKECLEGTLNPLGS